MDPCFVNIDTNWRRVISFMPLPFYPQHPSDREPGGSVRILNLWMWGIPGSHEVSVIVCRQGRPDYVFALRCQAQGLGGNGWPKCIHVVLIKGHSMKNVVAWRKPEHKPMWVCFIFIFILGWSCATHMLFVQTVLLIYQLFCILHVLVHFLKAWVDCWQTEIAQVHTRKQTWWPQFIKCCV
jgi:hypothetical protein